MNSTEFYFFIFLIFINVWYISKSGSIWKNMSERWFE